MTIDWSKLISLNYWFHNQPPYLSDFFTKVFLGLFFILISLSIVFQVMAFIQKKQKAQNIIIKFWKKIANFFFWMGIIEIILYFFRYERVPLLSSRFWLILWLILFFSWAAYIIHLKFKKVPAIVSDKKQKEEFEKYLPIKNKKRKKRK